MAREPQELAARLTVATDAGFRGRLLARGQAQSVIRRAGVLPPGAPPFSAFLDADLLNYGYALLSTSLLLMEASNVLPEQIVVAQRGFIQSSYAIEAATRNAAPDPDLVFHGLVAGAASHLGGYAARAYSLIQASRGSARSTPMEQTLADLIMRDLGAIERRTRQLRQSPQATDEALLAAFTGGDDDAAEAATPDQVGPVNLLLSENYLSALSAALFAIEIGDRDLFAAALRDLLLGEQASSDVRAPGPWWIYRLTRHLLGGLFDTSLEATIPQAPPPGAADRLERWRELRDTFVTSLLARDRAEIDLWPSQLHVVNRIFQNLHDLVVALPTSAGKTRIAELAILACLARGRRTVYITPLRALSAQTEQVLTRTFTPLGIRVSSLYGSMGASNVDEDTLRSSEIVVATPEKLDFALRCDPSVLDDVGLVVLDEGHMIGATEREVRYEAQIQRLLRRSDADLRRILCLSAVFPSGSDLDDFVAWITDDEPDGLHREQWRPTQQRFGLVEWRGDHARLEITLGPEQSFIPRYFEARTPRRPFRRKFPSSQREHVIATGWRLVEEGQTVLVFCPQRNTVEKYAETIIELHYRGLVASVLPPDVDLSDALAVGAEWFGADHPILRCLQLGVAIHHGALPGPFRREIERLLQRKILKVTIASPTLAQGLNLSASAVLFHGIRRGQDLLNGAEFANVIGRAGRAFVDTEGLVLYPLFQPAAWRRQEWHELTQGDSGRPLQSGLIGIGIALLRQMAETHGISAIEPLLSYVTGGPDWALPVHTPGTDEGAAAAAWRDNLALLDLSILSIVGEADQDTVADAATQILADGLRDSLFERQLRRYNQPWQAALRELVVRRTRHLWQTATSSQRRGWYLAGLGAQAGTELSQVSGRIVALAGQAETALIGDDHEQAADLIVQIADIVFAMEKFAPKNPLANRDYVIRHWVQGTALADVAGDRVQIAQFIETDLIYSLVWGLEAARVYEAAQNNPDAGALLGSAVTAIETGTFHPSAAILIRSGFDYRLAAIVAVTDSDATFDSVAGMHQWIDDLDPWLASDPHWPTPESRAAWERFANPSRTRRSRRWLPQSVAIPEVTWYATVPAPGTWLRITDAGRARIAIWSTGFDLLGEAAVDLAPHRHGVLRGQRPPAGTGIRLHYRGPSDLFLPSGASA
ncbi:DEAD/DEAH box helicase [Micromonospora sp. WMMD712]|uniref:DEAD/DEAH box helicase n=1 Tax=Micromonospora sp. WMMD712 TaxID=3016096 RepID=UPI00249AD5E3|nr:DEAD/DEAH box helicase [Micromonospora sp. WMMD712]WFE60078.1 DEAD/DEAH box helicase [Micromonospora sp. WMMD712]